MVKTATWVGIAAAALLAALLFRQPSAMTQSDGQTSAGKVASAPLSPSAVSGHAKNEAAVGKLQSLAPWADFQRRFRQGDYGWIIQNARSAPGQGSLSYAVQALSYCSEIAFFGPEEALVAKAIAANQGDAGIRVATIRKLFKACEGLGSFDQVRSRREQIAAELASAQDARENTLRLAARATDPAVTADERATIVAQLLALQDGDAASALKGAVTAEGVAFKGQVLTASDRYALATAWDMAVCTLYGSCLGVDSPRSQLDCAIHGRCDFQNTASTVQQYAFFSSAERMAGFHTAIIDALKNGRYNEFGITNR